MQRQHTWLVDHKVAAGRIHIRHTPALHSRFRSSDYCNQLGTVNRIVLVKIIGVWRHKSLLVYQHSQYFEATK